MPELFTWVPDRGTSTKSKPRVLRAKFGDGYEQRAPDGLNSNNKSWSLVFVNRPEAEGTAITAFLDDKLGATSFLYSPPDDITQYTVICPDWTAVVPAVGVTSISAKFEEVQG